MAFPRGTCSLRCIAESWLGVQEAAGRQGGRRVDIQSGLAWKMMADGGKFEFIVKNTVTAFMLEVETDVWNSTLYGFPSL